MRRGNSILVASLALALVGCAADSGQGCTDIGAPTGMGLTVEAPLASEVMDATIEACWDDVCRDAQVDLRRAATTQPEDCAGDDPEDSCSARSVATGDKAGFADIPDLAEAPVDVTVTLAGDDGGSIATDELRVTPTRVFPNGPSCGGDGVQAALAMSEDGLAVARD